MQSHLKKKGKVISIFTWSETVIHIKKPDAATAAKSLQSCLTLCDPIVGSPPGSTVPGILQARTLEWVAISFTNAWKGKGKVKSLSCVQLSATPWTAAYQAPLSMGFSRQEYWSGLPLPSPISPLLPLKNEAVENAGEGMEKWEPSYTVGGNVNGCSQYG